MEIFEEAINLAGRSDSFPLGFALCGLVGLLSREESERARARVDEARALAEGINSLGILCCERTLSGWIAFSREDWRTAVESLRVGGAQLGGELDFGRGSQIPAGALALYKLGQPEAAAVSAHPAR